MSEIHSMCNELQCELDEIKRQYEKQSMQCMKLKERNNKLKHKNEELNKKTLKIERKYDNENVKLREQLICTQCENKTIVKELQQQIIKYESNINKIKYDKDSDIELKKANHKHKIRALNDKFDKNISVKNEQIQQLEQLYKEEQEHNTQHFNKLMQEFDEYKNTQNKKILEIKENLLLDFKQKYQKYENNFNKIKLNNIHHVCNI